jgi:uncharacterized membrane protein
MINKIRTFTLFLIITSTLILAACGSGAAATTSNANATLAPVGANVSFAKDILPLTQRLCFNCHGGQQTSRALNLKSYDSFMSGSQNGPILSVGDAANSLVVKLVASGIMPQGGTKLTPAEVQLLTDWINAGAKNN